MILTLRSPSGTVHIDITADQFKRLRNPDITPTEIASIAGACDVEATILLDYTADIKKSLQECIEIDGSCDYSDHL